MYKAFCINQAENGSIWTCIHFYTPLRMDTMRAKIGYFETKNRKNNFSQKTLENLRFLGFSFGPKFSSTFSKTMENFLFD